MTGFIDIWIYEGLWTLLCAVKTRFKKYIASSAFISVSLSVSVCTFNLTWKSHPTSIFEAFSVTVRSGQIASPRSRKEGGSKQTYRSCFTTKSGWCLAHPNLNLLPVQKNKGCLPGCVHWASRVGMLRVLGFDIFSDRITKTRTLQMKWCHLFPKTIYIPQQYENNNNNSKTFRGRLWGEGWDCNPWVSLG